MSVKDQRGKQNHVSAGPKWGREQDHVSAGPAPFDCCACISLTQHTLLKVGKGTPLRDLQKHTPHALSPGI